MRRLVSQRATGDSEMTMDWTQGWLGNIHSIDGLARPAADLICVAASVFSGMMVGLERERKDKPAGLRTVILICLGSTLFTLVSLLLAERKEMADPARLASQIIPGIGFLGAGAIIRSRGTVLGLTTGATIWAVAAVGVTIGSGYVVAGLVFSAVILVVLTAAQPLTFLVGGRCSADRLTVAYRPDGGKTWPRLQAVLDRYQIPDRHVHRREAKGGLHRCEARVCLTHRDHRAVVGELAEIPEVVELQA